MTAIVAALLAELDDDSLDELARRLAPRLAAVSTFVDSRLTTARAAQRAGVHERTVRRARAAGTLSGVVIAGRWRIEPTDLDSWLSIGAPTSTVAIDTNGRRGNRATAGADAIAGRRAA